MDLYEFEASLVYKVNSRTVRLYSTTLKKLTNDKKDRVSPGMVEHTFDSSTGEAEEG